MAENKQKIKLLKLYELLRRETDEDHPISRMELCKRLNEMGISSNVRTLSKDIEVMQDNGFEVISYIQDHERYYYIPETDLSLPEIKILIDAVQAASFITDKKTAELIDKVASLGGSHKAELLKENMVCFNTRKHTNESILYNVNSIEDAIIRKKKIAFNYFHLNEAAERIYVTTDTGAKKRYYLEPVALIFNEDNYYLMAYNKRHPGTTASYRVDRIDHVDVVEESALSAEALSMIEGVAAFTEQAFKMFSGELEEVVLQFDKSIVEPVFDKFGEDTVIKAVDERTCEATVQVQVSPTFFGWLAQFGWKIRIVEPDRVRDQFLDHIKDIIESAVDDEEFCLNLCREHDNDPDKGDTVTLKEAARMCGIDIGGIEDDEKNN